jgi:pimeloyl-ACP methyl ester carboxylesterase
MSVGAEQPSATCGTVNLRGVRLHVNDTGTSGTAVAFSHGLFWDSRLFAPQIEALAPTHRCIAWDHRGQGRSEVTESGYDMDTLADDAIALFEHLDSGPVHLVGLSMGGFVAMRVALARPDLVKSLVLLDTSADPEPEANLPRYRLLRRLAGWFGLRPVIGRVMPILFGKTFLNDPDRAKERECYRRRLLGNHKVGILRAIDGVLSRRGVRDRLHALRVPTLVVVGCEDVATPPGKARALAGLIRGAQLVEIPGAGHTSTLEAPREVNAVITEFITGVDSGRRASDQEPARRKPSGLQRRARH